MTSSESRLSHILSNDFWGTPLSHSGSHKSYRPIVTLTFRINHLVTGAAPWAYHLTNIILHSLATYLLVSIIKHHYQTRASILNKSKINDKGICHIDHMNWFTGGQGQKSERGGGVFGFPFLRGRGVNFSCQVKTAVKTALN